MRVGWLADRASHVGGAELTQAEFRAAAPEGVEVVDCEPGERWECERYVVQNCVTFSLGDLQQMEGSPAVKYWHDVGPHLQPGVREWLDENARAVCCSMIQAKYMGLRDFKLVPPPIDLSPFAAAENGQRAGTVSVASWRNFGKAPHKVAEWAAERGVEVDFFGGGVLAPKGSVEVPYSAMPELLARYERFVFLPTVIEPFGRIAMEAWAAGCEVVVNGLVGALDWMDSNDPDATFRAIEDASADFWKLVLS